MCILHIVGYTFPCNVTSSQYVTQQNNGNRIVPVQNIPLPCVVVFTSMRWLHNNKCALEHQLLFSGVHLSWFITDYTKLYNPVITVCMNKHVIRYMFTLHTYRG